MPPYDPSLPGPGRLPVARDGDAAAERHGLLLVALAAIFWSTGGVIVRSLDTADVWTTVFWRSIFATAFLVAFIAVRDRRQAVQVFRSMGRPGLIVGVSFATASISFVIALNLTSVANTLVILSTSPFLAALLGRISLGERVRGRSWLAMAVALSGVAIMVTDSFGGGTLAGDLVASLIAVCLAVATVTIRKHRHVRMTPAACLGAFLAGTVAAPLAQPLAVTGSDFGLLVFFGAIQFGTGLALFTTGARLAPAAKVALLSVLEPILGPIWVWVILGEDPGTTALIGGGVVLSSLAVYMAMDMRKARPIPPAI